ncbi:MULTISPECIES: four helix bundle protein [unclassified Roseofilum]|uniref:four helix bundle protein n=1 Tax=unclassified Roseofilum TaxID=2620099 RepID=UPI001B2DA3CC|nr:MULTISPECIES: four helix bundle protein [unclassified Roseofilum]MBP0011355.1 four helix bundle protein [Roseofilum sp. Belize Diploria]MBP0033625.1 four helix bundle protein [Roseofilum sp. Belize BBD 4]
MDTNQQQNRQLFIKTHEDLEVYQMAFDAAMNIFELSKQFPKEERYSLTDQIRRSSRSVCANLAEDWRRQRYQGSFLLRLNDAEAEAAETQVWLKFAVKCQYLNVDTARELYRQYNKIIGSIVIIANDYNKWLLKPN